MFKEPKLVKFKNGTYGARQGWLKTNYQYLDLSKKYLWSGESTVQKYCQGTKEQAELAILRFKRDYGKIV